MKRVSIYFLITIVFIACNSKNEKIIETPIEQFSATNDKDLVYRLLAEAINQGNTKSYREVAELYFRDGLYTDFYFYSILMASKYNYSRAYFDSYIIMSRKGRKVNGIELCSDNNNSRKLANYFLLKSYELGLKEVKGDVIKVFGKNIPKSNEYFCNIQ